ncbi:MAG: T9SS type A sorting domain-containing protein [Bacteroidales bacterium]|nr:T9SS type A sorting domain-containing protein [Bacteroidales bacterium]
MMKSFTKLCMLLAIFFVSGSIFAQTVTVDIGTGTDVTGTYETAITPFGTYYQDGQNQILFTASELNLAGIGAGNITEIGWNVDSPDGATMNGFNIEMKHTSASSPTSFETGFTNCYSGTHVATSGWNMFTLSTPFNWDGSSNLLVKVCFDNAGYTSNSIVYYTSGSGMNAWAYNDYTTGCSDPYEGTTDRPNTRITGQQFTGGVPPGQPTNPNPANGATGVSLSGNLTWDWGSDSETYDLWYGPAGSMAQVVTGGTVSGASGSYSYTAMAASNYEWQLIIYNSAKASTNGPVWSFTTPYAITPTTSCQTVSGSFGSGGNITIQVTMQTSMAYNFSVCSNDACAGSCTGDGDFTMYDTDGTTQLWYIDGPSGCSYDATTIGSSYEDWVPPADGVYYLKVDDYYNAAASFDLAYIATAPPAFNEWTGAAKSTDWGTSGNWSLGTVPVSADDVLIPTGLGSYPTVDETATCNSILIEAGASVTIATGGDLSVAVDMNCNGDFIMNDGVCTISGDLNNDDAVNALVDINGGTLNVSGGWYQSGYFSFARGAFQLSGGNINVAEDVAWVDANANSLMDGPFYMTIGGTFQCEAAFFSSITDGTIELTGAGSFGGGYFLDPSGSGVATVYNLVVSGGTYIFTRDVEYNDKEILNDFTVSGGFVDFTNSAGMVDNFVVGNNCTVSPGASVTAFVTTSMTVGGSMTLEADASDYASWIGDGNLTVAAKSPQIVQVAMSGPQWHMISSPVAGAQSGMFTGMYLQYFDESGTGGVNGDGWIDITSTTDPLTPAHGFALYTPSSMVFDFMGSFNTTAPNLTLSRTADGWNAVGNPFTSPIDWDAPLGWSKTNVADAVYVEDNGSWATYINGVGTGNGSNIIAPGQGFFVECTADPGTLFFDFESRTHTRASYLKTEVTNLLKVQVEGNGYTDEMAIRFLEDATEGFDYSYDARKLTAYNDQIPQIYSLANGHMAINTLPETSMVETGFATNVAGEFTISATETSEFKYIILEDLFTGAKTNLYENSYTFSANPDDNDARFIIHFAPVGVEDISSDMVDIYAYNSNVYVNVPESTKGTITIFDMLGQEVTSEPINGVSNTISLEKNAYYVVQVITSENMVTKKVLIK